MKKCTKIILCIALALCLVSMIGSSLIQSNWGKTDVSVFTGSLTELAEKIRDNNETYDKKHTSNVYRKQNRSILILYIDT